MFTARGSSGLNFRRVQLAVTVRVVLNLNGREQERVWG